jgi:4-hydroxy 2-oxovalerate aldolase
METTNSGGNPVSEKTFIHILDSSLRDGSHALSHQYTAAQVSSVARGLDDAGVEMIEVSHGDGLGGSTVHLTDSRNSPKWSYFKAAAEVIKNGKLAVLLLPGIGTKDDLKMAADYGAKVAQIATHVTEADIAEQHIGVAKKNGHGSDRHAHAVTHGISREDRRTGKLMEGFGADVSWLPTPPARSCPIRSSSGLRRCAARKIGVGFHGHNNLSLAVANSVAAIEEGARWIDACTCGLGAGSGIHRRKCSPPSSIKWAMRPASTCGRSWTSPRTSCVRSCRNR